MSCQQQDLDYITELLLTFSQHAQTHVHRVFVDYTEHYHEHIQNYSYDTVAKLDLVLDELLFSTINKCPLIHTYISEERSTAISLNRTGTYVLAVDQLDGTRYF